MSEKMRNILFNKKADNDETISEFIYCCISCWFLSVGACVLFDSQFEFQTGVITVLWQTAISTVLVALVSRRWWISLISVVVIGLICSYSTIFKFGSSSLNMLGVIDWCIDLMPDNSPYNSEKGIYLLHTLINIATSIAYFAVVRLTHRSYIIALASLAVIIAVYAFGYTDYNIFALVFYFTGIFSFIASNKFKGHKLFQRKNLFSVLGNRWLISVISIAICFIISLTTISVLGNNKNLDIRNRFSSDITADFQSLSGFYTTEQQSINMSLYNMGLQLKKTHIGGSLPRPKSTIIASTDLKKPSLVKVTSFGKYDGKKWSDDFEKTYRFNGPWEEKQNAYLAGNSINDGFIYDSLQNICRVETVTFTLNADSFFLHSLGQTLNFSEKTPTKNPILFDKRGQIISYYGQKEGYSYTVKSLVYQTTEKLTPQLNKTIKEITSKDDPYYTDEFKEYYTKLSKPISQKTLIALGHLDIDKNNYYDAAYKICSSFSYANGYRYLDILPEFKATDNVVDKLLTTKEGHCVYYSTAVITMLRHLGIPSRLAAGYMTSPDQNGQQVLNRSTPYCWVECYLPNMGWLSFDPTPRQSTPEIPEDIPILKPDDNGLIEKPETDEQEDETTKDNKDSKDKDNLSLIKTIIIICLIVIIIAYLVCRVVFLPKFYTIDSVKRRFVTSNKQAEYYWRDILKLFKCIGYTRKKSETARELGMHICDEFNFDDTQTIMKAITVIEALHYGDITPNDQDIVSLHNTISVLEDKAKEKLHPLKYFIIRKLLRPII